MSHTKEQDWTAVDDYIGSVLLGTDPILRAALEASEAAGLPSIAVSPAQGRWLHIIAKAMGARRILELGTLGGYSAIWLARALPADGRLITVEASPAHADVARANLARAGLAECVDVRVGQALDVLPRLAAENEGPFDLVFIDADKVSYPQYLAWSVKLSRPGTLIVADNVIRDGAVIDAASTDPAVQAVRRFHEAVAADTRLSATAIQTVGVKGYDGLAFVLVNRL